MSPFVIDWSAMFVAIMVALAMFGVCYFLRFPTVSAIRMWMVNRRTMSVYRRRIAKTEIGAGKCPSWRRAILQDAKKWLAGLKS